MKSAVRLSVAADGDGVRQPVQHRQTSSDRQMHSALSALSDTPCACLRVCSFVLLVARTPPSRTRIGALLPVLGVPLTEGRNFMMPWHLLHNYDTKSMEHFFFLLCFTNLLHAQQCCPTHQEVPSCHLVGQLPCPVPRSRRQQQQQQPVPAVPQSLTPWA